MQTEQEGKQGQLVSLRPVCPTRWSLRTSSMVAVVENYDAVLSCLEEISGCDSTESGSKEGGLLSTFQTFEFFFGLLLGIAVFGPAEELTILLQRQSIIGLAAQKAAKILNGNLRQMRSNDSFDVATKKAVTLQVAEPSLPRKCRPPKRLDDGSAGFVFHTPKDLFRSIYFQFLDVIMANISSRFEQSSF